MRRILLLLTGALALALAVPGIASAHRGHAARSHHHRRHHHAVKAQHTSTPSASADAGRVASFTGGVLTITLADGSTVSGKVTSDTVVDCVAGGTTSAPTAGTARDGNGDQGDRGDDQGDGGHSRCSGRSACTTADLVPGAVVHEAIVKLGADGAEFKLVLLVKPQAA